MGLKEVCKILYQCVEKFDEDLKINLNDVNNMVHSNKLNETKAALERAKDYHYEEIKNAISEILGSVKKILFHQDKIDWLNHEENFGTDQLKRFSYVKRQIYAFSQNNEENPETPIKNIKRERRRSTAELSIGSLEAWEKYIQQKEKEEETIEKQLLETPEKPVRKRTLSNARRRKKFVSSTNEDFLEEGAKSQLDLILEETPFDHDMGQFNSIDSGSVNNDYSEKQTDIGKSEINIEESLNLENLFNNLNEMNINAEAPSEILNDNECKQHIIVDKVSTVPTSLENPGNKNNCSENKVEKIKPRIVDVIYKNKPS